MFLFGIFIGLVFGVLGYRLFIDVRRMMNDRNNSNESNVTTILDTVFPFMHYDKPLRVIKDNLYALRNGYGYLFEVKDENFEHPSLTIKIVSNTETEDGLPKIMKNLDTVDLGDSKHAKKSWHEHWGTFPSIHNGSVYTELVRIASNYNKKIPVEFLTKSNTKSEYII